MFLMEFMTDAHQLIKLTIMFKLKSTIYQTEWLNLVFENKNKSYGAYELRLNYDRRLGYSLFMASLIAVLLTLSPTLYYHFKTGGTSDLPFPRVDDKEKVVIVSMIPEKKETKPELPAASVPRLNPAKLKSTRFVNINVVSTPVVEDPPSIIELQNSTISAQSIEGTETSQSEFFSANGTVSGDSGGFGNGAVSANELVKPELLERYPEFPGGTEAFANYLRKYLRYPERAIYAGIEGKVFISFVIEKDGRLTDIKVLRGIGYGCDEEAVRVLKKSPFWKPGVQNSKNVRVLYTLPIAFHMGE